MHSKSASVVFLLVTGLLTAATAGAESPPHYWSQSFGASGYDHGRGCAVDGAGNSIVVGWFTDLVYFDSGPVLSQGPQDAFIAKYDLSGNHLWTRSFGGDGPASALAVDVDEANNIYVTGSYEGTIDFGSGPVTSAGDTDIFLVKLDAGGSHLWSQSYGDPDHDVAEAIAVDSSTGYIFLTGSFRARLDLGGGDLTSSGDDDIFLAQFKTAYGTHTWSRSFGAGGLDSGQGLSVDSAGHVVVTGTCKGPIDLGGGPLSGPGGSDIFMAEYDVSGAHEWSRLLGGPEEDRGLDVEVDDSDDILLTGYFVDVAHLGGGSLTSNGLEDVFLARYDSGGGHIWSRSFGGPGEDRGTALVSNAMQEVFLTGSYHDQVDFGGGALESNGSSDIFLAKFKATGSHLWSQHFGSDDPDCGSAIAADAASNVILSGFLQGLVWLGGDGVHGDYNSPDAFASGYDTNGTQIWGDAFGGRGFDTVRDLAIDGSGNVIIVGAKHGSVDFGGGPLGFAGNDDIFVAKFDPAGVHLWSKGIGTLGNETAIRVTVDTVGDIYVAGEFGLDIDFGGGLVSGSGDVDVFLVKYDSGGVHLWSKGLGGALADQLGGIGVDDAGDVIIAGGFQASVDFGGGILTSAGSLDVFVAKYDSDGAHLWSQQYGDWNVDYATALGLDVDKILVGGHFADSIDFGGGVITVDPTADFLVKFSSAGSHVWNRVFEGGSTFIHDVVGGPTGNLTMTGSFWNWVDLGGGVLTATGNQDAFIGHFDNGGDHIWSAAFGGPEPDGGSEVCPIPGGGFLATGYFEGAVDFGGGTMVSNGERDAYLAEFSASGVHLWSQQYGGAGRAGGSALGIDSGGEVLFGGVFDDIIDLGGAPLSTGTDIDFFLARFGPSVVDVESSPGVDLPGLVLSSGSPNPFRRRTEVAFDLPLASRVSLGIYDVSGRLRRTLVDGRLTAGMHVVAWDGQESSGHAAPPGIYFARVSVAGQARSTKLIRVE